MEGKLPQKLETNILEDNEIKEIYEKLYSVKRTGWVDRGVSYPENVGEHTDSLVELVDLWVKELNIENPERLKNMLRVHDWPEIIDGDVVLALLSDDEFEEAKQNKYLSEKRAMEEICKPLGEKGQNIYDLWLAFEANLDHDSQIGGELDKMQAILKAFEYETKGEKVSTKEFIDYVFKKNYIKNEFLLSKIKELQNK